MTDVQQDRDVIALIRAQHQQVKSLLADIATGPSSERTPAFQTLVRLLAVHETAEEMTVYPAIRKLGDEGRRVASERTAEEDRAKKALAELEGLDPSTDEFMVKFVAFRNDVEEHAQSEESEVFPLLERSDQDGRETMGSAFLLAEQVAPTHAHRAAPESALGNLLVGPFVGMVDRIRDAIRDARSEARAD
jgi:hemerythrin superfamily protein